MNKMLITRFDSEALAYKGLDALRELHKKGDVTLYAAAVIAKDLDGKVEVKREKDNGPVGTAVGMLTGAMVGLLGGPAAAAAGASAGGLTGLAFDAGEAGVNLDFLDEISELLVPGKSAVVAEIDEDWVTPVNVKMEQLGGLVIRRPRLDVVEGQLDTESAALAAEMKELKEEMKQSNEETKAAAKKTLTSVKKRLQSIADKASSKMGQIKAESEAKIKDLQIQAEEAKDEQRAKIENRIAEIRTKQKARGEKLRQAGELAKEALTL